MITPELVSWIAGYSRRVNWERAKRWRRNNPEGWRAIWKNSFKRNREKRLKVNREWWKKRMTDPVYAEAYRKQRREYQKLRAKEPNVRLRRGLRGSIVMALKRQTLRKGARLHVLLGADIAVVRRHIESQFKPGMTWDNYGPKGWHVDHKLPCASFDLTDMAQQKACFHYSNLQPLWWLENLQKAAKC